LGFLKNEDFVFVARVQSREWETSMKNERINCKHIFERISRRCADIKRPVDALRVEI